MRQHRAINLLLYRAPPAITQSQFHTRPINTVPNSLTSIEYLSDHFQKRHEHSAALLTSKDLFKRYLDRVSKLAPSNIDQAGFVMPESRSKWPLVWIDCEMTGLDIENDTILSLACFITDANLNLLDNEGYSVTVGHDQTSLDRMGEWCTKQHGESGLTSDCLASMITPEIAAAGCLEYIKTYVKEPKKALLAGNTVHMDRAFLRKPPYKPILSYLHHRILDVSSLKEAAKRWSPDEILWSSPRKKGLHEARQDILESIEEARFYRKNIFQKKD